MQALRKIQREQSKGIGQTFDEEKVNDFIQTLPFPLTKAQQRVVEEILTDMKSPLSNESFASRGCWSGKTVVAAIGLYATVSAGFQGALMVPTEILAEQHAESLSCNVRAGWTKNSVINQLSKRKKTSRAYYKH